MFVSPILKYQVSYHKPITIRSSIIQPLWPTVIKIRLDKSNVRKTETVALNARIILIQLVCTTGKLAQILISAG